MEIVSIEKLRTEISEYGNPDTKIGRMRRDGYLYRIRRGLYIRDKNVLKEAVSGLVCGPSYVSFEDALSRHGLIPERVTECSCATFGKQRNTVYKNDLGYYSFTNIPLKAFPYGVELYKYGRFSWNMATPEKAVCDLLYTRKPLKNTQDLLGFLFEGMRIEEEDFRELDAEKMRFFAGLYDYRNLKLLGEALS
ncbi:MAG: hypothetical protein E7300_07085 [Lachnospiraceae bacterium]|nr:hypothetical protein [Lachnospiraceae bacterium]